MQWCLLTNTGGVPYTGYAHDIAGTIFSYLDTLIKPYFQTDNRDTGLHLNTRYGVPVTKCDRGIANWWQKPLGMCKANYRFAELTQLPVFPNWDSISHQQVWEGGPR
jgi:hypothetical protein